MYPFFEQCIFPLKLLLDSLEQIHLLLRSLNQASLLFQQLFIRLLEYLNVPLQLCYLFVLLPLLLFF